MKQCRRLLFPLHVEEELSVEMLQNAVIFQGINSTNIVSCRVNICLRTKFPEIFWVWVSE